METQDTVISRALRGVAGVAGKLGFSFPDESFEIPVSMLAETGRSASKLLHFGHDEALERTRILVLERAGFRCRSLRKAASMRRDEDRFELMILCHSLELTEACRAVEQMYLRSPSTTILRLANEPRIDEEACFRHVLVAPTPDRLIATVQRLCLSCSALR